jgi:hypothetical protein
MKAIQYYVISHDDALSLGVTEFRQGTAKEGYLVHSGDFACATADFLERAIKVSEQEALEFIKSLKQ